MSKKQWYKDQWDKEVFKQGIEAWNSGKEAEDNPYDLEEEGIDYALWLLGWSHAMVHD